MDVSMEGIPLSGDSVSRIDPLVMDSGAAQSSLGEGEYVQVHSALNLMYFVLAVELNTPIETPPPITGSYRTAAQKLGDFFDTVQIQHMFTDSEFQQISSWLKLTGTPTWSQVPRLYSVLPLIDQLHVLNDFINSHITDEWFPFERGNIPNVLGSSMQTKFLDTQCKVITKGLDLEKRGVHASFDKSGELPFMVQEKLGEGAHGKVHKITSSITGRSYARKEFGRLRDRNVRSFINELQILKTLNHCHCVELVRSAESYYSD